MDENREERTPSIRGAFRDKAPEETADVVDTILEKPAVVEDLDTPEPDAPDTRDEQADGAWTIVEEEPPALTPEESANLDRDSLWDEIDRL